MTSSMLDRMILMKSGVVNAPSVTDGSTIDDHVPQPETGKRRHCTAKSSMSMMPIQNTGIDWPRKTTTVAEWSATVLRRTAL